MKSRDPRKFLILFSGLHQGRPYYKQDVLNVACLHQEARILFAYRRKWFADSVTPEVLRHRQALIVFPDRLPQLAPQILVPDGHPSAEAQPEFEYLPMRLAHVRNVLELDDHVNIELELERFFQYEGDGEQSRREFQNRFVSLGSHPNRNTRKYVTEIDFTPNGEFHQSNASLIRLLGRTHGLNECHFISAYPREAFGKAPHPFLPKLRYDSAVASTKLPGGKQYSILLHVVPGSKAKFALPTMETTGGLTAAGPFIEQHSSGLQVTFLLRTARTFEKLLGHVSIEVNDDGKNPVASSQLRTSIVVGASHIATITTALLLSFGLLLFSATSDVVRDTVATLHLWGLARPSWLAPISPTTVATVAKALGWLSFGIGSVILVKKLPVK